MPAFLFPGQGSQKPGMGRPWRHHPSWEVVEDASRLAGRDIGYLLLDAGAGELAETCNSQLATFVMGLVVLDAVERLGVEPTVCAGHSLGEYTALVAAGALGFEDAVRLVSERGEAMQEAAEENPGVMLAVSGIDDETARIACRRADGDVWLANSNGPGECVIAGRPEAAQRAADLARTLGATRVRKLAVNGAFHTALMAPAQPRLRKALEDVTFFPLAVPVVANVDALPHNDPGEWPSLLSAQLRSPVRWRQSTLTLFAALHGGRAPLPGELATETGTIFCELGPGGRLSALVAATLPAAATLTVEAPDDLDVLVANLTGDAGTAPAAHAGHEGERLYVFERLVVSPCAGVFDPASPDFAPLSTTSAPGTGAAPRPGEQPLPVEACRAGAAIAVGDLVGYVSGNEVRSPFAGELMGWLAHPGERVQPGQPLAWLRAR